MKAVPATLALALLGSVYASPSRRAPDTPAAFERLVAFGDSYSDNGNTFRVTGYPAAPYFDGRYSNGPTWVEHLANATVGNNNNNTSGFVNMAYGGAYASKAALDKPLNVTAGEFDPPDLTQQLQYYLGNTTKYPDPKTTLYTVFAGGNDYVNQFQSGTPNPRKIGGAIVSFVQALHESPLNATNFVVLTQPSFAGLPIVRQAAAQAGNAGSDLLSGALNLTVGHNQVLAGGFAGLAAKNPALKIRLVDFFGFASESSKTFKNGTASCVVQAPGVQVPTYRSTDPKNVVECRDPDSFFYWDDQHPTAAAHKLLGALALKSLSDPSALISGADAAGGAGPKNGTSGTAGNTTQATGGDNSAGKSSSAHASIFGSGAAVAAAAAGFAMFVVM
ncbi:hypothetical protein HDU86_003516 [Geranomyces michiganensis]|nr:hypothetical protein HDU86_003516 [Geranomyces michiganensis]